MSSVQEFDNPRSVLDRVLSSPWWDSQSEAAALLAQDWIIEWPFAPPGVPKVFPRQKRALLASWLHRTVKYWSCEVIKVYPTRDPSRFWVESRTRAEVSWGLRSCPRSFDCSNIELIVVRDGWVVSWKTWSDPLAFYLGAGINLPVFPYDGLYPSVEPSQIVPDRDLPRNVEEEKQKRKQLFDYFLHPDHLDPERDSPALAHLFTPDFTIKMPFMPVGMKRVFDDQFRASTKEWVERTVVNFDQNDDFVADEFVDPDLCIVESNGSHGMVKWDPSGATAGYWNDYVIFVKIKDFRLQEFREYLDPVNKLLAAGISVPVFPFFY